MKKLLLVSRSFVFVYIALCIAVAAPAVAAEKININTAPVEQLLEIPGIGPALAERIVEYRTAHPFVSIEELMNVKGIGDAKFEKLKDAIEI